jgi:hypothetical protein
MSHCLCVAACLLVAQLEESSDADLAARVSRLVRQLDDDDLGRREEAEEQLVGLGPAVLEHLPATGPRMTAEVETRLARVRNRLERDAAAAAAEASTVTLRGEMPLSEALALLGQQTGNRLVDYRDRFGQTKSDPPVRCDFERQPYWAVLDQLLDEAGLRLYSYSGTPHTLAFVNRDPGHLPAQGRVSYGGLFRFEAVRMEASRDLRDPDSSRLRLTLEIAWEPRVQPIALTQPIRAVTAIDPQGGRIMVDDQQARLEVPAQTTVAAVELDIPFRPPPRTVAQIASLRGTMDVMLPGREAEFRFDDLPGARNVERRNAGVTVVLQAVRPNATVQDVRILVRFDQASGALESHRGWIYGNQAYLVDAEGKREDHAGFETTAQLPNAVGLSYKFVIDRDLKDYAFVYKTAAAIIRVPVDYQLRGIDLP